MKLIELNIDKIYALCRQYGVKTLSVFGSILTEKFNAQSDVDFLVDFNDNVSEGDYVTNYFSFRDALKNLFNRDIDLIEEKGLRNKFFISEINNTKVQLYG